VLCTVPQPKALCFRRNIIDNEEFVARLKQVVHDDVTQKLLSDLESPAGRNPPKSAKELSLWLSELPESDKDKLQKVVTHATHSAIFGMLAVLDGVRAIEDDHDKGSLKLMWETGATEIMLNDRDNQSLHDIYQSTVFEEVFGK